MTRLFLLCILALLTFQSDTSAQSTSSEEASAEEAQRAVEAELANQGADFDYSRAALQLAEASAQLRTLQKIRKNISKGG